MNKEQFIKTKSECESKLDALQSLIYDAQRELYLHKLEYIASNRKFQDGDLVSVVSDNESPVSCFIASCEVNFHELRYKFLQIKKDGTPSNRNQTFADYDNSLKITLIKAAEQKN